MRLPCQLTAATADYDRHDTSGSPAFIWRKSNVDQGDQWYARPYVEYTEAGSTAPKTLLGDTRLYTATVHE